MKPLLANEKDRWVADFELVDHPADELESWFAPIRKRAIDAFARVGFPSTRVEEWKYTDIAPVLRTDFVRSHAGCERLSFELLESLQAPEASGSYLVFIDGNFCRELSSIRDLPVGVVAGDIRLIAASENGTLVRERLATISPWETEPFIALNTAMTDGGAFVYVPDGCEVAGAVHVVYLSGGAAEPAAAHPRTLVVAGANSGVRIIETFASVSEGPSLTNAVAEFALAEGARVEHYRVQREGDLANHIGSTDVRVCRSARYSSVSIAIGSALARHDLRVQLVEQGAECQIDGLYVTSDGQHTDSHTRIDHLVPHCSSSQLYKGVLDGRSRAVFNGKVVVHHDAQKTEAHQTNRNLMLSPNARVDTKPELEIFADDVICTHGATVGALEDEERFYLASRGLDEETARGLLTYGFAREIIDEIQTESVRQHLDDVLIARFHKG